MILKNNKSLFLLFLFYTTVSTAQQQDVGLWQTISIEKEWSKKWATNIEQEARFSDNIGQLHDMYWTGEATYKLTKKIRFSGYYRFSNHTYPYQTIKHRFGGSMQLKYNLPLSLEIAYKLKYQSSHPYLLGSDFSYKAKAYVRNQFTLSYQEKGNKLTPYLSGELFHPLAGWQIKPLDGYRATIGIAYQWTKKQETSLYYRLDKEINQPNPMTRYIIGIGYGFSF